jgi:hypothetical protein
MGFWQDLCDVFLRQLVPVPTRAPQTHDYTVRTLGHDVVFTPADRAGYVAYLMGSGVDVEVGDFLILPHAEGGTTRYEILKITHFAETSDMWSATARFSPRPEIDTAYEPSGATS